MGPPRKSGWLMKMLSGRTAGDGGENFHQRLRRPEIHNPRDARNHQIETIYQYLALAD